MEYFLRLSLLGSTGSIGTQTLEVVREHKNIRIIALAARSNYRLLEKQAREFMPKIVCLYDEKAASELKVLLRDTDIKVVSGMDGLIECAVQIEADTVLTAVVGMIGIKPTIAAIEAGKRICLANKESLVCAGHIIMPLAAKCNIPILPVDSEHSAIFQSLQGGSSSKVRRIILTGSGGPFRGKSADELKNMRVEDALNHPVWAMGKKITIDSASLVNKGLELIEAGWLFDRKIDEIDVVIHPECIVHSAVEYADGSVIAQLGKADMKLPIRYALYYPTHMECESEHVDFYKLSKMTFFEPDRKTFRGLEFAERAMRSGGSMPTVFNAANEFAVSKFLKGEIGFLDIYELIDKAMSLHKLIDNPTVDDILEAEKWVSTVLE